MAPVGTFESLAAAAQAGANSFYFGVEQLNMRAKSTNNFTMSDLPEVVRIARQNNMKAYMAVNTIMYDHDIKMMKVLINKAKQAGIDALIISDQAAISYAKEVGIPIHISTQVNVSNIETLKFYALFADVMVLARELSLKQVAEITKAIDQQQIKGPSGNLVRIEIFAHGALCMAVSGKCYLSLHEQNSSANRGACLQTCRKSYIVTDKETGYELEIDNEYIMSPKDLMTIDFLDQVVKAGVGILKIEGRARPAEYVKTTVECYREAAQAVLDGTYTDEKIDGWIERLKTVFNRGFWDGYYLGRKLGEWSKNYGSLATKRKIYVGKVTNYFKKIGVVEFEIQAEKLAIGDNILVSGPTTGVFEAKVDDIRLEDQSVSEATKGQKISMKTNTVLRRADKLYKVVENLMT